MVRRIVFVVLVLGAISLALFLMVPGQAHAVTEDFLGKNHARQHGYLDFNGDGKTDVFRTNGSSWLVSYGGNTSYTSSWYELRKSSWQLENGLCFGDFDGNGKTDVFLAWAGSWYISYDGTSPLTEVIKSTVSTNMAFGDFDGDGETDVFLANGADWYVSYSATTGWNKINGSNYRVSQLAFGDFNGDGKTDVFRASGSDWYVSYGGTSAWTKINGSNYKLGNHLAYGTDYFGGDLGLGDFNGDGKTDVFRANNSDWYVSWGGTSGWTLLNQWVYEPDKLHFADFDGNGRTDVFKMVYGPYGYMVWFREVTPGGGFLKYIIYPNGPVPDMTPPVISDVTVSSLTPTSATVTWNTDEPATSQVRFGVSTSYNRSTSLESTLSTSHRHPLTILGFTELIPDTNYFYEVVSRDAAGNESTAAGTFTTPPKDTTPPTISAVQVTNITPTSVTITWTTDELSDSGVAWGPTTSYGFLESVGSLVTAHSKTLDNLSPDTLYHFRVRSRDAAGNLAISGDYTFTTAAETGGPGGDPPGDDPPGGDPLFTDVPESHPYFDAIQYMGNAGMLSGYPQPDGTALFRPDNNLLRAQFAKLVCGAFAIPVSESLVARFTDLGSDDPTDLYPHDYVEAAASQGIIQGKTPTTFDPWAPVTRAQMVTMVVRAAQNLHPGALLTPPAGYQGTFGDFSPDHQQNMRIAEYNGLLAGIVGFGPSWNPWDPASRGEVAQVLVNWIQR